MPCVPSDFFSVCQCLRHLSSADPTKLEICQGKFFLCSEMHAVQQFFKCLLVCFVDLSAY